MEMLKKIRAAGDKYGQMVHRVVDYILDDEIAFMFSLFESCKLNDINFGDYIEDILTRLMEGEQDFISLIPCNYNSNKKVNVKAA